MNEIIQNLLLIASISAVYIAALISPGPDFFIAVRNSLKHSRKTGIYTAIGIGFGIMVHVFYCLAGLAFVISQSIMLFNAIKLLGAAYLVYIGIKSLRSKSSNITIEEVEKEQDITTLQAIKIGFLTNVLNPKATIFFLGLFTFVITPETPAAVLGVAAVMMVLLTMIWFSLVATFFSHSRIQKLYNRFQGAFNKTLGGLLILLGIKVAVSER